MTGRHVVAGLMVAGLMATGCGGTGESRCDCKGVLSNSGTQTSFRRLSIVSCSNAPD